MLNLRRFANQCWTVPKTILRSGYVRHFSETSEIVISFKNVSHEYVYEKPILKDASFVIRNGYKVTIMGQNGSGKSTMIKLINGSLKPNSGTVNLSQGSAVATAMQVMPREYRELTVLEFFTKQLHGVTSGIDSRIANALHEVELVAPYDRLIKSFSGGQQARLLLASALALEPDILLLDEPTNNLDVAGVKFLTEFIKYTHITCVVISHDEHFLNAFSDCVLYLDQRTQLVEQYQGNYNQVKASIAARIKKENSDNARLLKEAQAKKEQANVFANKGGGMRLQAKKMREAAEELETRVVDVRKEDNSLRPFTIPFTQDSDDEYNSGRKSLTSSRSNNALMTISSVMLPGSEMKPVPLRSGTIELQRGYHVRIKGPNGIGKTTLLEEIANNRMQGVDISPRVTIGYYRQDFDNLDFDSTVLECLENASSGKHDQQELRKISSSFFLSTRVNQKVATLSEGQKGLVSLCCLVLQQPGILIMDEPTNHINFRHLPALAEALSNYEGALLLVSHDTAFTKKVRIDTEIDLEWELEKVRGGNKNTVSAVAGAKKK